MKLKVGLLNDSFPPIIDGVAAATKAYADNIHNKLGEAVVIVPKYPHVTDDYDYKVYRYHSVPSDKMIGYRAGNPFSPKIVSEIRDEKLDILHVHCPFASGTMARVLCSAKRCRVPKVFTYHTKFNTDIKTRVKFKQIQRIAHRFVLSNINHMDEVWVVSEKTAEDLREFGYKGEYRVMRNGTDFKKGKATNEQINEIDRVFRLQPDESVFIFVGRMMWYKNVKIILDSLKIIKEKRHKFRMFFIGDGRDRGAIEKYAEQCDLKNEAVFLGEICDREKLRAFYSRSDLLIFPSTYDTCGLVVMEAAACDCPSLLVRDSCAAETITENVDGYLCEENAESCAEAIISAISDPEKLKQTGINASETVYYPWDKAVKESYKRYEAILNEPKWRKKK
ncbi:MAG: glycosyltransferase [Clostridia bacterium]|nr:glycosyltransferase [Clostridia bacterium]